jgi:hypothetical protein
MCVSVEEGGKKLTVDHHVIDACYGTSDHGPHVRPTFSQPNNVADEQYLPINARYSSLVSSHQC